MYTPRILVVGGNAAGPSAAAKAKRTNPDAEVIMFEAGDFISTGTCELPYLFSGEIKSHEQLVFFTAESFYRKKGVKVYTNHLVNAIDRKLKEITVLNKGTNESDQFKYDKLILATGSLARELPDLPFSLTNVFSLKSVNDYLKIKSYVESTSIKKILIVGSGYIGLELVDTLSSANYEITLLEREKLPFPAGEPEIQHIVLNHLESNNIQFLSSNEQTKYLTSNNRFNQLKHNGRFIDFDMVIVTSGVEPNTKLARDAKLEIGKLGGLVVDNRLKTSDPNIFAAGDNIEVTNIITRKPDHVPLATHAHEFGHIAGENATGGNKIVENVLPISSFKFFDRFIATVGLSEKNAKKYRFNIKSKTALALNKVKIMPDSKKVFGKIVYDNQSKMIVGASFIGGEEVSGYVDLISSMIYSKTPVNHLSKYNYNYTPPLSPFINILSVLGRKIEEE